MLSRQFAEIDPFILAYEHRREEENSELRNTDSSIAAYDKKRSVPENNFISGKLKRQTENNLFLVDFLLLKFIHSIETLILNCIPM